MMSIELPVFNGDQPLDQMRRYLVELHQHAVFVVRRIYASDRHRIQPRQCHRFAGGAIGQGAQMSAIEVGLQRQGRLGLVPKCERTRDHGEFVTSTPVTAGVLRIGRHVVIQHGQFHGQLFRAQFHARIKFEWSRIDPRRHGPALAFKLRPHGDIEIKRES